MDFEDEIFLAASQMYEKEEELRAKYGYMGEDFTLDRLLADLPPPQQYHVQENADAASSLPQRPTRFAAPVSEEDLLKKITGSIPKATRKSTAWATTTWKDWATNRQTAGNEFPPKLSEITNERLNYWLSRFVVEVRNKQGLEYQGGSLYSLCAGVQRHLRSERRILADQGQIDDVDIFKDSSFAYFRSVLDSVLKDLHKQGIGTTTKRADCISEDTEEKLWEENVLGDDTPAKLVDTLVFCFGLNFALRSGQEHRDLRPDMLQLVTPPDATAYLIYTESGSKNWQGGLNERKVTNKSVKCFANDADPSRCCIRLYQKYMALRPKDSPKDVFYLKPFANPCQDCWYYNRAIGHNVLGNTVKRLCTAIGVDGHFTNYSLWRTCATRLFQAGVDEQQIMGITGHRTTNAVRLYKEISQEQEENSSKILQVAKKVKPPSEEGEDGMTTKLLTSSSMNLSSVPVYNFTSCSVVFHK